MRGGGEGGWRDYADGSFAAEMCIIKQSASAFQKKNPIVLTGA